MKDQERRKRIYDLFIDVLIDAGRYWTAFEGAKASMDKFNMRDREMLSLLYGGNDWKVPHEEGPD